MFKIESDPTFATNVTVRLPGGAMQTIRVTFNYLNQDRYDEVVAEVRNEPLCKLMAHLVRGWETSEGKDPKQGAWDAVEVPYSPEVLEQLQNNKLYALRAMLETYQREVIGFASKN